MSTLEKIALGAGTVCVGAVGVMNSLPAGGYMVANGIVGLGALGLALRRTCAKRACEAAQERVLADLKSMPDLAQVELERADYLLTRAPSQMTLSPSDLSDAVKAATETSVEQELARKIHACIPFEPDDRQIETMLERAILAGVRACYDDKDFKASMTRDLVIRTVQNNGLQITLLQSIDTTVTENTKTLQRIEDDLSRIAQSYNNDPENALNDLRDIAAELAHPKPHRGNWDDLVDYITNKIRDQLATITRYEQSAPDDLFGNTKKEIASLLRERRYGEANALFDGILEMGSDGELAIQLQKAAFALEGKADIALNDNRVQDAYDFLTRAADSFASVDPLEPARRRTL